MSSMRWVHVWSGALATGAAPLPLTPAAPAGSITATTWPAPRMSPGARSCTAVTTPAQGAVIRVSIFMAVTTATVSPACTASPTDARTSITELAMGHSTP